MPGRCKVKATSYSKNSFLWFTRQCRHAVLVVAVVAMAATIATSFYRATVLLFRLRVKHAPCSDVTVRDSSSFSSALLSSDELSYIWNGNGTTEVAANNPRYLNYIRSFVTRPAAGLQRRLVNGTGRRHFSQVDKNASSFERLCNHYMVYFKYNLSEQVSLCIL